MKTPLALLLIIALATDSPPEGRTKAELKKLEGTWKVLSLVLGGKKVPPEHAQRLEAIVIQRDRITMKERGKKQASMGLKIDPTKKPPAMDLAITRGQETIVWKCIYELKGDDLKICMPLARPKGDKPPGPRGLNVRPDSFETEARPLMLITARRESEK